VKKTWLQKAFDVCTRGLAVCIFARIVLLLGLIWINAL
jgi:hypothetical protein